MSTKIEQIQNILQQTFSDLVFIEETHTYSLKSDTSYKFKNSATGFIKNYVKPFDFWAVSNDKGMANLNKNPDDLRSPDFYRKRWKLQEQEALARGNRVHYYAECYPNFDEPYCDKERGVLEFYQKFLPSHIHVLFQEFRMYDKDLGIAGTADVLLYDELSNSIVIADWKTNNKNLFEYYDNMTGVFSNQPATNYTKYSIQLSIYKYLIEKHTNLKVSTGYIVWLNNQDKFTSKKSTKVKSLYKSKTVKIYAMKDFTEQVSSEFKTINFKTTNLW